MAEHLLCKERVRSSSLLVSTTPGSAQAGGIDTCARQHQTRTEEPGSNPGTTLGSHALSIDGSQAGPRAVVVCQDHIEPLIRVLSRRPPTSGSLGPPPEAGRKARQGRTFTTGYVFRQKLRSSISPSWPVPPVSAEGAGSQGSSRPRRDWPPGQVLEGVKLLRARGGCLGAKSR